MIKKIDECYLTSLNKLASNFNLKITNEDLKKENEYYVGYFDNEKLIAFINYSIYYERAEINYIFVIEEFRKKSIATKLLNYMITGNSKLENITLEVRESNKIAISFYKNNGFEECAIRHKYYGNENAILMIRKCGDKNE